MNRFNPRPGMFVEGTPPDAKKKDQNTAAVGPARFEPDEVVLQVADRGAIGGGVAAVPGSYGVVVGLPPGLPYVYVPANLVSFPINFAVNPPLQASMSRSQGATGGDHNVIYSRGKLSVDTQNVIGTTNETVLGVYNDEIHAYDTIAGVVTSVGLPATGMAGVVTVGTELVTTLQPAINSATSVTLYVYDGAAVSSVTFNKPSGSGTSVYKGAGASGDGTELVMCWWDSTNSRLYVTRYNTAGVQQSSKYELGSNLGVAGFSAGNARIENGYVLYSTDNLTVATEDDTSNATWKTFNVNGVGEPNMCIGSTGIGWLVSAALPDPTSDVDVYRLNYANGSYQTFTQALTDYVCPFDPVATNLSATHGITYISDTKFGVCSAYYDSVAGTVEPIYITVTYTAGTPGSLTLSQLRFSAYATATNYPATDDVVFQYAFGPTVVGTNVVFTIQTNGAGVGGFSGDLDLMWRVTA